jgi:hypothetical protein
MYIDRLVFTVEKLELTRGDYITATGVYFDEYQLKAVNDRYKTEIKLLDAKNKVYEQKIKQLEIELETAKMDGVKLWKELVNKEITPNI